MKKIIDGEALISKAVKAEQEKMKGNSAEQRKRREEAGKAAKAEIDTMTAERVKAATAGAMSQIIEALAGGSFDKAALDSLAKDIAEKAMLEPAQAEKMPNILAKALLLEARKEGLSAEMKDGIRKTAEEILLPLDMVQTRAKEILEVLQFEEHADSKKGGETEKSAEEKLREYRDQMRRSFIEAHVKAICKETGVRKEAAEAKLLKALRELEDEDLMRRAGNGE